MSLKKQQLLSAQVVLRSASGKLANGATIITSKNFKDFAPAPEAAAEAAKAFTAAGFEVGSMVGIGFSITASASTFEKVFKARLRQDKRGGVTVIKSGGADSYELPLKALPQSLVNLLAVAAFTPPPDFGPTQF